MSTNNNRHSIPLSSSGGSGTVTTTGGTSTDNAVARFDGTDGTKIQNTGVIVSDTNSVTGIVDLTATGWVKGTGSSFKASTTTNDTIVLTSTGLSVTLQSSKKYWFSCKLFLTNGDSTDGVNVDLNGGTFTVTNLRASYGIVDAITGPVFNGCITDKTDVITLSPFDGTSNSGWIEIEGVIETNAGGTLIPRFSKVADSGGDALTLYRGSFLIAQDIT